jgi:hypothetical protein
VADIDQELATAILTSEMREKQLSPGNCFVLDKPLYQCAFYGLSMADQHNFQFFFSF